MISSRASSFPLIVYALASLLLILLSLGTTQHNGDGQGRLTKQRGKYQKAAEYLEATSISSLVSHLIA